LISRGDLSYSGPGVATPQFPRTGLAWRFSTALTGLAIRDVVGAGAARLLEPLRITGIATWSPDGRVLLLGAEMVSVPPWRLLALDLSRGSFCVLANLPEGHTGDGPQARFG